MKVLLLALLLGMSQSLYAGCETILVKGGHTALTKKEARSGAIEEVTDACPSLKVMSEMVDCTQLKGGSAAHRCTAEAYCNLCDDDLARYYEAQSD